MGILAKHSYKVPPHKIYKEPHIGKTVLGIFAILIIVGIILALSGCSVAHKTSKAYEKIALYPPLKPKDTLNLLNRAKPLFPTKKPIITPGRTVKVPPVIKTVPDTKAMQKYKDSLLSKFKEQDSISKDEVERQISETLNTAYDKGFFDAEHSFVKEIVCPPDTCVQLTNQSDIALIELQTKYNAQSVLLIQTTTERDISRKEAKNRLWLIIALSSGLLLSVYLQVKGYLKPKKLTELIK